MKIALPKPPLAAALVALAVALAACGSEDSDGSKRSGASDDGGTAGGGGGEKSKGKVVASNSSKGKYPTTLAHASLKKPGKLKLKVTPTPARKTHGAWTVACRRGRSVDTSDDRFTVRKASTRTLKQPLKNPDTCEVSASAQMVKRGRIKVQLLEYAASRD